MNITKHTFNVTDELSFDVRVILRDGEPWFVAKDVANALGYKDTDQAIRKHCKRATKGGVESTGGSQETVLIPESDLYRLIMRSRLESAERFEDWITETVLPSIRKYGVYASGMESLPELAKAEIAADTLDAVKAVENRIACVCYAKASYTKKQWEDIGLAYCAAEAITKRRGEDDIQAFYKEFALQLTLYKVPFRACYEKNAMALFNEAFRIEQDFKKSLRKHQHSFSSW
ncbi:BRO family protein [Aeromonas bestiarum]|uniref:BRO family protein n=1 Tax=Aeromonas bestiarum TaxID=105751 RepID=A0AAW7HTV9_9GAMM|nr:BRO family protein [Aeromonas bestiarum]MDM5138434.1 BRO family protein [Aeromonas bestiarum]